MAVLDAYKNLALAQVATPPSPPATGTSLTLTAGQAANLPAPPFNATVFPVSALPSPATAEIVRVTAIAGDVLTITRVQEGTAARTVLAGDYLAATFTTKFVTDVTDSGNQAIGTLPDARLSANVPRLNAASNVFTGTFQELGMAMRLRQPAGPVDQRVWQVYDAADGNFYVQSLNDAGNTNQVTYPLVLTRVGNLTIFGDFYEKNRSTPLGSWTAYTPTITVDAGSVTVVAIYNCSYTLIGKTMIVCFALNLTLGGAPTKVIVTLPLGSAATTIEIPYAASFGTGMAQTIAGGTTFSLLHDVNATALPAGSGYHVGTVIIPLT